jgi:hypothetical protein
MKKIKFDAAIPFITGGHKVGELSGSAPFTLKTPDGVIHTLTKKQWLKLGGAEEGGAKKPSGLELLKEKYDKISDKKSAEALKLAEEIKKLGAAG